MAPYITKLLLCGFLFQYALAKGSDSHVECTPDYMTVTVPMDGSRKISYLEQLKDYKPCAPIIENDSAVYRLELDDPHKCGVTRIVNKLTGKRVFYHKVVVEDENKNREVITVRCVVVPTPKPARQTPDQPDSIEQPHALSKRATSDLPIGFQEPETLEIKSSLMGQAPEPQLGVEVKQNGRKVSGEISVSPGTNLSMEIFLDNTSAPVYGLLVGYLQATDTISQQETIIFNGCSIDPHLFDNFVTSDGDLLMAKFRAFKFPDTTYVQFKGTVTVCLDKCQGVACSNGVTGYGRKKRSINNIAEPNRIYEISLTAFIKVEQDAEAEDVLKLIKNLQANQFDVIRSHQYGVNPAVIQEKTEDNQLILHNQQSLTKNSAYRINNYVTRTAILISFIRFLL